MKIVVYTTKTCPACQEVKRWLRKCGLRYSEVDLENTDNQADLIVRYGNVLRVPVLEVDGKFYEGNEIFEWMIKAYRKTLKEEKK